MTRDQIIQLQQELADRGLYTATVDGQWGTESRNALAAALALIDKVSRPPVPVRRLAWGARVSQTFRDRVCWMADNLAMPADGASWLMACMAWESAETFAPDVRNMAGSGATGLIQFMPSTALAMDTTVGDLAQMTAENQLNFVFRYFKPLKGRLQSLGDVYMAILWPAGIGKPENFVLWDRVSRPTTYRQNAGLDINKDGAITRAEAVAKVQATLERGMNAGNAWEISA